jgi:hypothetical protein
MHPWLQQVIAWLAETSKWVAGECSGEPPLAPLVHQFTLSGPVNQWYHSSKRTVAERRAFASLLLAIDADPFIGEPMLEQATPGQRSIGFAAGPRGYGVIYQVHAAANPIRMVSIVPP